MSRTARGQAVVAGQMGKADVFAFGYRELHQRGFRCAQSGGKLKKAHGQPTFHLRRHSIHIANTCLLVCATDAQP